MLISLINIKYLLRSYNIRKRIDNISGKNEEETIRFRLARWPTRIQR